MAEFARDVLGLTPGHRDDRWAVFRLESGDRDLFEFWPVVLGEREVSRREKHQLWTVVL